MPKLTRWLIKSALVYLVAAFVLAFLLSLPPEAGMPSFLRWMRPVYFHLFLVGWVTQIILGVIYWMFPIITRGNPRGSSWVGWGGFALLNGGLLLRVVFEPLHSARPDLNVGWVLPISALCQWLAAVLWVILAWPRVKERYRGG